MFTPVEARRLTRRPKRHHHRRQSIKLPTMEVELWYFSSRNHWKCARNSSMSRKCALNFSSFSFLIELEISLNRALPLLNFILIQSARQFRLSSKELETWEFIPAKSFISKNFNLGFSRAIKSSTSFCHRWQSSLRVWVKMRNAMWCDFLFSAWGKAI